MKNVKKYLPTVLLVFFIITLWPAIYIHTDGLGIFSIIAAIILLCLAHYKQIVSPPSDDPEDHTVRNMEQLHDYIFNDKFIKAAIPFLIESIIFAAKKYRQMDPLAEAKFRNEIQSLLIKYQIYYEEPTDHEPEPSNHTRAQKFKGGA